MSSPRYSPCDLIPSEPTMNVFRLTTLSCILLFSQAATAQEKKWELAPHVMTTIPSRAQNVETFTGPLTLPISSKAWKPYSIPTAETLDAKRRLVVLRRPVWNLELSFKPIRMIRVPLATSRGVENRLVWYMVYRIRYLGNDLQPSAQETSFGGKTYPTIAKVNAGPHRFFPEFLLRESSELNKSYKDRFIPEAIDPIFQREFKANRTENLTGKLHSSISISTVPIQLSTPDKDNAIWGVATWDNIDPRVDYFSIYIRGLSNGFLMEVDANGSPGKTVFKTLKLNFSRPGDSLEETEEEIQFGIPVTTEPHKQEAMNKRYGQDERVDYQWLYLPPLTKTR